MRVFRVPAHVILKRGISKQEGRGGGVVEAQVFNADPQTQTTTYDHFAK